MTATAASFSPRLQSSSAHVRMAPPNATASADVAACPHITRSHTHTLAHPHAHSPTHPHTPHVDPEDGDSSHESKVCYDTWPPPPNPPDPFAKSPPPPRSRAYGRELRRRELEERSNETRGVVERAAAAEVTRREEAAWQADRMRHDQTLPEWLTEPLASSSSSSSSSSSASSSFSSSSSSPVPTVRSPVEAATAAAAAQSLAEVAARDTYSKAAGIRALSWTRSGTAAKETEDAEVKIRSSVAKARLGPTAADSRPDGCIPGCLRAGQQCRDVGRAHNAYLCSFPPEQLQYALEAQV